MCLRFHSLTQMPSGLRATQWYETNLCVPSLRWLSLLNLVIESGPERDTQGKMSGTFNTAKAALDLNLPVFVVNPSCLDNAPKGNADLIALGGYSLNPADGAREIVELISVKTMEPAPIANQNSAEQLPLF